MHVCFNTSFYNHARDCYRVNITATYSVIDAFVSVIGGGGAMLSNFNHKFEQVHCWYGDP